MKLLSCLVRAGLWAALAVSPTYGSFLTFVGDAYAPGGGAETRATWAGQMPSLIYDDVNLAAECTGGCGYSYNRLVTGSGGTPGPLVNVSGQTISGVTFVGSNSNRDNALGAGGSKLFIRPLNDGTRNSGNGPNYNSLAPSGFTTQWVYGFATESSVTGTPSMTMSFAPAAGVRAVGFDFGSINSGIATSTATYTITATTAGGSSQLTNVNRYDTAQTAPFTYTSSGPGFYGITSTEDILTVTIIANANSNPWILNLANFRVGVQINAPTPEPATFLAMGSALILISFLLRRRGKFARGGAA